ncbi:putative Tctex 1 family [Trypanosoma vivax]|uniref:Dynein light chain, putative n=1 Tax=Trypanosoma vivax (strain Y486) TaxID=1055687 RepID=F9WTD8_TRYVY|nr:putative dynein-light chain-protein [Trypanosoma vivax]KAH8612000.1 putative Tctex 1 family [Trypanosoma vivax]CCC52252.1 putative dynein-light chain-protein [Trypanosoma vivax Y486]CCD20831.1 dynein light chain, putative [Trypanosoma vivax Y486]|eukprot:CCD20831.1 dynein light chain, putative [Trypanosoma vivax Y486]
MSERECSEQPGATTEATDRETTQASSADLGEGTSANNALKNTTDSLKPGDMVEDHNSDGEEAPAEAAAAENPLEINGVPPNDVKNIILQVLSPYFDDEGGEDDAQRYDHIRAHAWIQLICDGIMEKLLAMRRPYKYVVHCMIMRKNGAAIHVCSSCYYSQADGWVNHAHDLSPHVYAVVTVYWSVI